MTALGSSKIWILVPDWPRLKSSEPKAGDVSRKIGPLYFNIFFVGLILFKVVLWHNSLVFLVRLIMFLMLISQLFDRYLLEFFFIIQ